MANDATNSPPLMVLDMENLRTSKPEAAGALTRSRIRAGVAEIATAKSCTSGSSSRLSDAEQRLLARIAKDRRNGFMVAATDVDFLLEILGRLGA